MGVKHLQLKAFLSADKKTASVSVVEQTHCSEEFGVKYSSSNYSYFRDGNTFKHGRIRLFSDVGPCNSGETTYEEKESTLWVFVRGYHVPYHNRTFNVTVNRWAEIKEAVDAYNDYFKEGQ